MKLTLFIVALLSIATFTNAETFLASKSRKFAMSTHVTAQDFTANLKKSDFGKTILNLASLQFKTSGKLDDVLNLLSGLTNKLQAQQQDDDAKYTSTSENNAQIIKDQSQIIATTTTNIQTYTQQLGDAQSSLTQLQLNQVQLQNEQASLIAALADAAAIREREAEAFDERTESTETIIEGLQAVQTVFAKAVENKQVNQGQVDEINSLIDQLIIAFQVSIAQDTQLESQAIQDYNDFVSARQARLAEIAEQLASLAIEISNLQALISQLQDAIDTQKTTRSNAQVLKDRTVQAQADLDQRYNSNKAVRAQQIQLLATAATTLSNNSASVQNYLNQA